MCFSFLQMDYHNPRTDKPLVEATVAGTITKVKAVVNWVICQLGDQGKWINKNQNPLAAYDFVMHNKNSGYPHY